MRTIFEDTELTTDIEERQARGPENQYLLPILWLVAIVFIASTWGIYRWATERPAPTPPPPPVSIDDPKQTGKALGEFNRLVKEGNWTEAENMLSTAAKQRLAVEQKSLRESLLGNLKDYKVSEAATTPSIDRSEPDKLRQDCVFILTDAGYTKTEQKIIPLVLVKENERLVIDGWEQKKEEPKKPEDPKQAAAKS